MYNTNIFALLTMLSCCFIILFLKVPLDMYPYVFYYHSRIYIQKTKCSDSTHLACDYQTDCRNYHMSTTCVVFLHFRGKSWPVLQMVSTFRECMTLLLPAICSPLGEGSSASSAYLPFQSSFPGIFIWLNYFNILNITSEVSLELFFIY